MKVKEFAQLISKLDQESELTFSLNIDYGYGETMSTLTKEVCTREYEGEVILSFEGDGKDPDEEYYEEE